MMQSTAAHRSAARLANVAGFAGAACGSLAAYQGDRQRMEMTCALVCNEALRAAIPLLRQNQSGIRSRSTSVTSSSSIGIVHQSVACLARIPFFASSTVARALPYDDCRPNIQLIAGQTTTGKTHMPLKAVPRCGVTRMRIWRIGRLIAKW